MAFQTLPMGGVEGTVQTGLDGSLNLSVEVQPGSKREVITGVNEWRGRLQIAVRAEAKKGAANHAVVKLLSDVLGIGLSHVSITQGATSRQKLVRIDGLSEEQILNILNVELGEEN